MYIARYEFEAGAALLGAVEIMPMPGDQLLEAELARAVAPLATELESNAELRAVVVRSMGGRLAPRYLLLGAMARDETLLRGHLLRWHRVGEALDTCRVLTDRVEFDDAFARAFDHVFELHNQPEVRDDISFYPALRFYERLDALTASLRRAAATATFCWVVRPVDAASVERDLRLNLVRMQREWVLPRLREHQAALVAGFLQHGLALEQYVLAVGSGACATVQAILNDEFAASQKRLGFSASAYAEIETASVDALAVESVLAPRRVARELVGSAAEPGVLLRLLLAAETRTGARDAAASTPVRARRVFVSYAHADREFARQFSVSCAQLRRDGWVDLWSDAEILPGTEWRDEIHCALEAAEAIVLLVSPDFIHSDFCYGIEMARALERHARGDVIVLPIIIRSTDLRNAPIEKLQYLPTGAKPVTTWPDRDEAWLDVVSGIRRALMAHEQRMGRTGHERPDATR